jgi:hypothetical protein
VLLSLPRVRRREMSILANKTVWLVVLAVLCVGLSVGAVFGSTSKDADAAKKPQLKTLWAVITPDGGSSSSKGLSTSERYDKGNYILSFNRDISKCAKTATASTTFMLGDTYQTSTYDAGPRSVGVLITNDNVGYDDPPYFQLVVNC